MTVEAIFEYMLETYSGTIQNTNWGERGIFYNPELLLKKGTYLLSAKEKQGKSDSSSKLDRKGGWRLNFGVSKPTYQRMFGELPARPGAGGVVDTGHDFSQLDVVMPHPVYAWGVWLCILSPSEASFDKLKPLLKESYELAVERYKKRMKK